MALTDTIDRSVTSGYFFQLPNDVGLRLGNDSAGRSALYLLTMRVSGFYDYQNRMSFREYVLDILEFSTNAYNTGMKRLVECGYVEKWQKYNVWYAHWVVEPSDEVEEVESDEPQQILEHFAKEMSGWRDFTGHIPGKLSKSDRDAIESALETYSTQDILDCISGVVIEGQKFRTSFKLEQATRPHNIKKYSEVCRQAVPSIQSSVPSNDQTLAMFGA